MCPLYSHFVPSPFPGSVTWLRCGLELHALLSGGRKGRSELGTKHGGRQGGRKGKRGRMKRKTEDKSEWHVLGGKEKGTGREG